MMHQNNGVARPTDTPREPRLLPDPDLIGNLEGNDDIAKADTEAARKYVSSVTERD